MDGILAMLAALSVVIVVAFWYGLKHPNSPWGKIVGRYIGQPESIKAEQRAREVEVDKRLAELTKVPDKEEGLRAAEVDDMVVIEQKPIQFKARLKLLELKYFGEDKSNKQHTTPQGALLREFQAFLLQGGKLLIEQPSREEGEVVWFLYSDVTEQLPGFHTYLKGTKANPGPGMLFAQSEQEGEVYIDAFGKKYRCLDLVWADIEIEAGKAFVRNGAGGTMPRVVMILAQCEDDGKFILSIDLREGGDGSDKVFLGERFDPRRDID